MFKYLVLKKYEIKSSIQYKIDDEEDLNVIAYDDNETEIGSLTIQYQYVDDEKSEHSYPFGTYFEEPFFNDIISHGEVINIQDVHVEKEYQKQGIALELMKKGMAEIKSRYPNIPIYINASPYGNGGNMSLATLVNFYKKFGFKVLKEYSQHRNALLWKNKA